jgi:HlyD family secretion protein
VVTVLERRLDKIILRAPADCVVSIIAAGLGENVRARQAVLMVDAPGEQWLSFSARDHLGGRAVGRTFNVMRNGANAATKAVVTELRPLGVLTPGRPGDRGS